MPRTLPAILAATVVALLLAACNGEEEAGPAATATVANPTSMSSPAAAASAVPSAPAGAAAGAAAAGALGGFCGDWAAVAAQTAKLSAPTAAPADIKASVESTNTYLKALVDKAPTEVKADFQLFAKTWSDVTVILAKSNYDMMKATSDPEFPKVMQAMSDPNTQKASANISAYMSKNCTAGR